jgi:hypothetical protein
MIVSSKPKNNETIICENCAVFNVEWKKYPARIVYLVYNVYNDVEGTGEIRSL